MVNVPTYYDSWFEPTDEDAKELVDFNSIDSLTLGEIDGVLDRIHPLREEYNFFRDLFPESPEALQRSSDGLKYLNDLTLALCERRLTLEPLFPDEWYDQFN